MGDRTLSRRQLVLGGTTLDLSGPQVMGILNVTPDSFSDGGRFESREAAVAQARRMADEGAAIIDVGGESTRPGARPVSVQEEVDRVVPVVEALHREVAVPISVDTSKPEVMRAAVSAGAALINDVRALRVAGALEAAAELGVPVCLMHMKGEPPTMQDDPRYQDVVGEVVEFLAGRVAACEAAGIGRDKLLLDPGFGFGKRTVHNLALMRHLSAFERIGLPLLVGVSRKSLLGAVLAAPPGERLIGSVALALLLAREGASIVRVHDVGPTAQALALYRAIYENA